MPDALGPDVVNDPNFIGPGADPVPGGTVYDNGETADVDTEGCYIVFALGSHIMDICDTENEGCMINTGDLDEKFGIWEDAGSFEVCWYKWHQLGTTSPENWYLVRPKEKTEKYSIECRSSSVKSIEYDGTEYDRDDYGFNSYDYGTARFVLTDEGVECRPDQTVEYDYCADISSSDAYNNYIVVAVKETNGYEFGDWIKFYDMENPDFSVDTGDCLSSPQAVPGTWADAQKFLVCKYGYSRTGGDVTSYYLIEITDEDTNIAIKPYIDNDINVYFYGIDNVYNSGDYEGDGCLTVSREGVEWVE
jgi:hypothetical protein